MGKKKTYLYCRDESGIGRLKLNRPEVHNAFNDVMIDELTEFFSSKDKELRLLVLSGEGRSFCAGADLNWMKSMKGYTDAENFADFQRLSQMFQTINKYPAPILGCVHGAALGGGAGLLAVCDYVIAQEGTKMGFTEVRLGLLPAVISPYVIAKIGESWGRALLLSGEIFDAQKALAMGLAHTVVEKDHLDSCLEKISATFLKAGPKAVQEAKRLVEVVLEKRKGENQEAVTEYTCQTISRIRVGDEAQEGMSALLEKRSPYWTNKS